MTLSLCAISFLSGAAALIFENLWFYQAGIALGNSVWASSLVLASFMAGLALGNGLVGRVGWRIARPLRAYAGLEITIGLTGIALVVILPLLTPWLAPLFAPFLERPAILNPLRFGSAFLLLAVPATAMGCTLPLVVAALSRGDARFGRVLGLLYGWNTLGAVCGALAPDAFLVEALGVRGTGGAALALNVVAALGALALARHASAGAPAAARGPSESPPTALTARLVALLAAAALAGFIVLALEVVWFRFLLLFVRGSSTSFAIMLAVVLAGIASGGMLGSAVLTRASGAHRHLMALALVSGGAAAASYAAFRAGPRVLDGFQIAGLSLLLMFPVALLSGVFFTWLGQAVKDHTAGETRATGLLTLANTAGGVLGSLVAGFVLLPQLGVERSLHGLAGAYGVVAVLVGLGGLVPPRGRATGALGLGFAAFAAGILLFPNGAMRDTHLRRAMTYFLETEKSQVVLLREGLTETLVYTQRSQFGEPVSYRLMTNGFSMSSTDVYAQRYMRLFVHLPAALLPRLERALLISYGVGTTASALVETPSLAHIDVVDISRDVLESNRVVFPDGGYPLDDPRVETHVEDGRYFLQTTDRRYDLITGEPPPPKWAGIVSLYTREYFELVHARLAEGGMASYWLPVHSLVEADALAIIRAFCDAFADCTLWGGSGLDWILLGGRGVHGAATEADVRRQWEREPSGRRLRQLGVEGPDQLGALFMADTADLDRWTEGVAPLVDDFPKRLSEELEGRADTQRAFRKWMDPVETRGRFRRSAFARERWPASLRAATLAAFEHEAAIQRVLFNELGTFDRELPGLDRLLVETDQVTLPKWLLGTHHQFVDAARAAHARGAREPGVLLHLARDAIGERDYAAAAGWLEAARAGGARSSAWLALHAYALCQEGRARDGMALAEALRTGSAEERRTWHLLDGRCAASAAPSG